MRSRKIIVILSGEIASGKSAIREGLVDRHGFEVLETKKALKEIAKSKNRGKVPEKRNFLQDLVRRMDKETNGQWPVGFFQSEINAMDRVIIDSARIEEQIDAFRRAYGHAVHHIHTIAPEEVRREWFMRRKRKDDDFTNDDEALQKFEAYSADPTEQKVHKLKEIADLVVYTNDTSNPADHVVRVAGFLRILPKIHTKNVDVVIGGQFGSEGKGQIAAYLSKEYDCLVRVGGPNAGHKVFNDPEPDVFHIIPSGTNKNRDAKLVIGPGAVISQKVILDEIQRYNLDPERLVIDPNVTVIEEKDVEVERKMDKIGSTAQGVGAATASNLFTKRLMSERGHKASSNFQLKSFIGSAHDAFERMNLAEKKILLEGTQGTFLSLYHGFYPHVTSRDTTVSGCLAEAGLGFGRVRKVVMVVRRYPIRVQNPHDGTSGEFHSNEISFEEVSERSGFPLEEMLAIETTTTTGRQRRVAEFNWGLFRKACELNTPTDIAFTFADYIEYKNQRARRYDQLTERTTKFIDEMERCAEVPVSLIATRFAHRAIIDRRNWI